MMLKSPHPALDLSFMCLRKVGGGIVYWNVESTGSYAKDYERGIALGKEFLDYIGMHPTVGNATLLGCIVIDMEAHPAKGLKLGFMRAINDYAMGVATILEMVAPMASGSPNKPALAELIVRRAKAEAAWDAVSDEKSETYDRTWDAFMAAEEAIVGWPCATMADVRAKAEFFLSEDHSKIISEDSYGGEDAAVHFLRSLLAFDTRPEAAAIGETFQPHQNGEDA